MDLVFVLLVLVLVAAAGVEQSPVSVSCQNIRLKEVQTYIFLIVGYVTLRNNSFLESDFSFPLG
jgi:hypothetical protein